MSAFDTPGKTGPGDDDLQSLAGEYVLGTLSAAERRAVEARLPTDPALRDAVSSWETRLLPLVGLVAPVEPSASLWERIASSVMPAPPSMVRKPAPSASAGLAAWWHSLALWRGLAAGGCAAAVAMATLLAVRDSAPPRYMVVLVGPQDKAPGWVVQAGTGNSVDLIPLATVAVPAQKSLQFWTKADGWNGPVSLGLVQPGHSVRVPLAALPPLQPNQLFELTLEPAAGSPIGRPTGPVQFIGRAVQVL